MRRSILSVPLLASVLAGALMAGLSTAPAAAAAPVTVAVASASGVQVLGTSSFVDEYGLRVVLGQVQNVSGRTLENVRVVVDQTDESNRVLLSTVAPVLADRLDSGERSSFEAVLAPLSEATRWAVRSPAGDPAVSPANHRFTTEITGGYLDEYGLAHTVGTVRNNNTAAATVVSINATSLDAAGAPVGTDRTLVETANFLRMAPGEVGGFDVMRFGGPAHSSVLLMAEAGNDPSPLPTVVTISGGGSVRHDRSIPVTGRVVKRGTDTGAAGVHVEVHTYSAFGKRWTAPAGGVSDANGTVRVSVPPQRSNTTVKLRVPTTTTIRGSESGTVLATVNPVLRLSGSRDLQVGGGGVFSVANSYAGAVELQRKHGKRWVKVANVRMKKHRLPTSQTPPYQYHYVGWAHPATPKAGKFQFRAVTPATAFNGPGVSNAFRVKVIPL